MKMVYAYMGIPILKSALNVTFIDLDRAGLTFLDFDTLISIGSFRVICLFRELKKNERNTR